MVRKMPQEGVERTCGTPPPSAEILKVHKEMSLQPRTTPRENIEVATYFHVVQSPERKTWVNRQMVAEQVCNLLRRLSSTCSSHPDACLEPGLLTLWDHFSSS